MKKQFAYIILALVVVVTYLIIFFQEVNGNYDQKIFNTNRSPSSTPIPIGEIVEGFEFSEKISSNQHMKDFFQNIRSNNICFEVLLATYGRNVSNLVDFSFSLGSNFQSFSLPASSVVNNSYTRLCSDTLKVSDFLDNGVIVNIKGLKGLANNSYTAWGFKDRYGLTHIQLNVIAKIRNNESIKFKRLVIYIFLVFNLTAILALFFIDGKSRVKSAHN